MLTVAQAHQQSLQRIGLQITDTQLGNEGSVIPMLENYANLIVLLTPQELIEDNIDFNKVMAASATALVTLKTGTLRVMALTKGTGTELVRYLPQSRFEELVEKKRQNASTGSSRPQYVYCKLGRYAYVEPEIVANDEVTFTSLMKVASLAAGGGTVIQIPEIMEPVYLAMVATEEAAMTKQSDQAQFWASIAMGSLRNIYQMTGTLPPEQGLTPWERRMGQLAGAIPSQPSQG